MSILLVIAAGAATTVSNSTATTTKAVEPDAVEEAPIEEEDFSEAAVLKKKGIPMPPSQERKAYLAWKKKLPKKIQKKIDRHCREHGGEFQQVCNGIGPYAIPVPPSRVAMKPRPHTGSPRDNVMSIEQWEASLTPVQHRYYEDYCSPDEGGGGEGNGFSQLCGGTPIVLAFGNERVQYTQLAGATTDWPTATTPWLARDLDGDGAITETGELFGSGTPLQTGRLAAHGFAALRELDGNRDGVLDASDDAFATLLVWTDRNGDRESSVDELRPLADTVISLSLDYSRTPLCDVRGNCEGERAAMQWRDDTGAVRTGTAIDVYLRYQ